MDFFLTLVFMIAMEEALAPALVLAEILTIYNREFCLEIENDPSIQIHLVSG